MDHAAAYDIALVESWGYTRNEAIELVIRRALVTERDVAEDRSTELLAGHRAYLEELRTICLPGPADRARGRARRAGLRCV